MWNAYKIWNYHRSLLYNWYAGSAELETAPGSCDCNNLGERELHIRSQQHFPRGNELLIYWQRNFTDVSAQARNNVASNIIIKN
jgi:hypothetical protein